MKSDHTNLRTLIIAFTFSLLCVLLLINKPSLPVFPDYCDLETVKKNNKIRIGILQNSTDYSLYNGTIIGFHYELAQKVADMLGVHAQFVIMPSYWNAFFALINNEVDLLTMDLNYNISHSMFLDYTVPHSFSPQVLVQRKDSLLIDKKMKIISQQKNETYILSVPSFSIFYDEALNLSMKTQNIKQIQTKESVILQDYLYEIEAKQINMTITYQKLMHAYHASFPNLNYSVELSDDLPLCWAVKKGNKTLLRTINLYLSKLKLSHEYNQRYTKYYFPKMPKSKSLEKSRLQMLHGFISRYDNSFKRYAAIHGIDWRFVAAIAYKESKFNPDAQGQKGAFGLMQFMPSTAQSFGVYDTSSVDEHIEKASKYLKRLLKKYMQSGVDSIEAYKFVLAAYNAGDTHIDDAMYLAHIKNLNPYLWKDVETALINLSNKEYIKGIKLKAGTYHGKHAAKYTADVYKLYQDYCCLVM